MSAALDALAHICDEGNRECLAGGCPRFWDDITLFCDVCIAGAVWYAEVTTRQARLCATCSHLHSEHTGRCACEPGCSRRFCDCCSCSSFIDEPDFRPSRGSTERGVA